MSSISTPTEKEHGSGVVVQDVHSGSDHVNPYTDTSIAYDDKSVVENQGRLRRLFSFVQLLAFALTFMSSWEVVAM